jgi:hypothetical protein
MRVVPVMSLALMLVASSAFARDRVVTNASFGWALVSKGSSIATSTDELNRLLNERTSERDRVLYARFGEDEYLVRDRVTLDRIDQLVAPVRELSEKAREIVPPHGGRSDKVDRREWKERLRPFKEKRRELLLGMSGEIEALARAAVRRGQAQYLD